MTRFGEVFDCPLCRKWITPPHVKRHLRAHDRRGDDKAASDAAWVAWLDREDERKTAVAKGVW